MNELAQLAEKFDNHAEAIGLQTLPGYFYRATSEEEALDLLNELHNKYVRFNAEFLEVEVANVRLAYSGRSV